MLAGAVVVQARGPGAALADYFRTALRQGFVRAAGKIAFLAADVGEHPLNQRDVFRFPAMGCACDCNLVGAPAQLVKSAGLDERHDLERLGARAPVGLMLVVPRSTEQPVPVTDDGCVYAVGRFYCTAPCDDDIEFELAHGCKINGAAVTQSPP